jgi:phage-related protein
MRRSFGKVTPERCSISSWRELDRIWDSSFGNCSKENDRVTTGRCHRVFELRDQDERSWYRLIYLSRINDVIYALHCFEKKSREMPRKDFEKVRQRLKAVTTGLAEERKHEKRG